MFDCMFHCNVYAHVHDRIDLTDNKALSQNVTAQSMSGKVSKCTPNKAFYHPTDVTRTSNLCALGFFFQQSACLECTGEITH